MTTRFNPIFNVIVTPASVSTRTSSKGTKYAVLANAKVEKANAEPVERTVMAFGKARDEVASLLRKGRPVELAVQHDGPTLKVIGLPRAKVA